MPEFFLKWFQYLLAKVCARFDGQVGIIRNVGYFVYLGDFAVKKVAEEEILGQTCPS
jgi:hypothetical protein